MFQLGYIPQNKKSKYLIIKVKNLEALVSKLALTSIGFPPSQGLLSEALQDVLLSRKFSASAIILKQSNLFLIKIIVNTIDVSFVLFLSILHSASLKMEMWEVNLQSTGSVYLSEEAEIWPDEIYLYVSIVLVWIFYKDRSFLSK